MKMQTVGQIVVALALALGMQSAALAASDFLTPKGERVQAEISGNQMILIGLNKERKRAPDGIYKSLDGKSVVVQGGIIVQGGAAAPGAMQYKMAPAHKSPAAGVVAPIDSQAIKSAPTQPGELLPAVRPSAGIISPLDSQAIKGAPTQPGTMATPPAAGGMPDLKK